MRKNRKSPKFALLFLFFVCLCCLGVVLYTFFLIPAQVTNLFGQPYPQLSTLQRYQYSLRLYQKANLLLEPFQPGSDDVLFKVDPSEDVSSITTRLQAENLITSADAMTDYLIYTGYDRMLRSGEYYLSADMSILEIAEKIHSSAGDRMIFGTIPGWRVEEIADSLESYGFDFSREDFLRSARHPAKNSLLPAKYQQLASLEGYLLPGRYEVDRNVTADELTIIMVQAFDKALTTKIERKLEKNGLTIQEAVILASIVEKEAVIPKEKPLIASVFFNRLATGMKLETDPTVQYSLGYNARQKSWWTNPLSLVDLQTDSAYNTYLHQGLPPGPICSPSIDSLQAVANPEDSHYYYFRSACDGSGKHNFSTSLEEHIQNACP